MKHLTREEQFCSLVEFFKALADESRLKIVGLLAGETRSVEELAVMLDLKPPTVSHHLSRLKEMDLVTMEREGNTHLYALNEERLQQISREILPPNRMSALVDADGDAWEHKVLNDFFDGERLTTIPASRKKRLVILKYLADLFEVERTYSEAEVNEVIKRHHPDVATLRRELIMNRFMDRKPEGIYWRTPARARTEP